MYGLGCTVGAGVPAGLVFMKRLFYSSDCSTLRTSSGLVASDALLWMQAIFGLGVDLFLRFVFARHLMQSVLAMPAKLPAKLLLMREILPLSEASA